MILRVLLVALGGAIGSVARYLIGGLDVLFLHDKFPVRTIVVNVTGALAIGLLWGFFDRFTISDSLRSFIFIGLLGGYTTFSTFSLETFNLVRDGEYSIAALNILLSVALSVGAVFAGFLLSRYLTSWIR